MKYTPNPNFKRVYDTFVDMFDDIVGNEVRNQAVNLAPVDTGRLRSSIIYTKEQRGTSRFVIVSANTNYAIFQELGTTRMRPQPYLRPGYTQAMPRIMYQASRTWNNLTRHLRSKTV